MSSRIVIIFRGIHSVGYEGGGSRDAVSFSKRINMVHYNFARESPNQHFESICLVGRDVVKQKSTPCTFSIMLTILDDL